MFVGLKSSLERIIEKFTELKTIPRKLVKIGFFLFLAIFAIGTVIAVVNRYFIAYNPYFDYIANELVKTSFNVLAEFVVGGIVMDFVFGRK